MKMSNKLVGKQKQKVRKNRNVSITKGVTMTKLKTETYVMNKGIPCIKNYGWGWKKGELFEGLDYEVTNLSLEPNPNDEEMGYSFELWDEEGWIGNYKVPKSDWENSVEKIA
jgi:hypothetical protein